MKVDLTSSKFYTLLLKVSLAAASLALVSTPMVWISQIMGYNNVVISGHHILFGNSGMEPLMRNIPAGTNATISLNPQSLMIVSLALMLIALALTFKKKKTFLGIPFIIFSLLIGWLACDHFGWLEKSDYSLQWGFWLFAAFALISLLLTFVSAGLYRLNVRSGEFKDHLALLSMLIPGTVFLIIFAYLPMPGVLLAFKNYKLQGRNVFESFFKSAWVGFNNFRFIFSTPDAGNMTFNTVGYNLVFIVLGLIASVAIAVGITEISNRRTAKVYQTLYFLPYFLSWVVVSYLAYALLNYEFGVLNNLFRSLGLPPVEWYMESKYWPFFFVLANLWKYAGNGSIIYMATIVGMDTALFESAAIDGANRFKQIWHITLPLLKPTMILLTILAMGRIFYADFGLFYLLTRGMGQLKTVSMVIDKYVYTSLSSGNVNLGMTAAVALYQSIVGFALVLLTNLIVSKISPDNTLL